MSQQCNNCDKKDSCQEVYRKLGCSDSPPVTSNVIQGLFLPLVLFVVAVAGTEKWLAGRFDNPLAGSILALAAAAFVICLYLLILKLWRIRH